MTVAAAWCLSPNVGDALAPWLIRKIRTGEDVAWVPYTFEAEHYIVTGSILNHANDKAFIWGAGIASMSDGVNGCARIFAIRGPISRARALSCGAKCPAVYGDPGLLVPRWYDKPVEVKHDVGYIPHYVDFWRVSQKYAGEFVIDVLQPVESFVDQLRSCKRIASSSLHGIVLAHAYGIPAAWVQWGDSIGGDGTKYRDYLQGVGIDVGHPVDRRDHCESIVKDAFYLPDAHRLKDMTAELWGQCPIRRPGE